MPVFRDALILDPHLFWTQVNATTSEYKSFRVNSRQVLNVVAKYRDLLLKYLAQKKTQVQHLVALTRDHNR